MGRTGARDSVWQWEDPTGWLGSAAAYFFYFADGIGGGSMGRASFVVKRGVWGTFVVLVWRKIQLHITYFGLFSCI